MEPGPSTHTSNPSIVRDDNQNLVIGKTPFTIEAVCETLTSCNSTGTLWNKLIDFARNLGLPENKLVLINASLTLENKTNYAVLHEILSEWQNMESAHATLQTLFSVLETTKELQSYADSLRKQFCNKEATDSNDNVTQIGTLNNSDSNNVTQSDGPEAQYYIDDTFAGSRTALLSGDPYQFEDSATTRRVVTLRNIFLRIAPAIYFFLTCASLVVWVLIAFVSENSKKVEHI
ncbi:unnamed protein product [Orchesella dallaii]|uniref:Death domain-containing protein n=1 Tax=Orchesella dallaii TaxID=48710 RepID=A0ABP1RGV9_9HEXA